MGDWSQPALPFRGEFGEPLNLEALAAENDAGDGQPFLAAVLRDPHLAELDRDLCFTEVLLRSRRGTFDSADFLDRGRRAIAGYVRRGGFRLRRMFTRESNVALLLEQKLIALANPLSPRSASATRSQPLRPSRSVADLFNGAAYSVPLTPVRGARVLYSDGPSAASRYAWRVSTSADPRSRSCGTARPEFGRAVFVDDVDIDARTGSARSARADRRAHHIRTQIVVKGVGPTRYAINRFSRRASGALTLLQGERDWMHSEALACGGVAVYRPLELALLPYCGWHPRMGWWPMVIYARLPLENLRVSDLELLPPRKRRQVVADLRSKVAALSGDPAERITDADVVRFFVARIGRVAGLCESGCTFGGRPFFHGFLHPQNLSLLGELVDLGEGRFVSSQRELRDAYARSGYVNPERNWTLKVRRAGREAAAFLHVAHLFAELVTRAGARRGERPWRELDTLFWRSHSEGRAGVRADCAQDLLCAAVCSTPRGTRKPLAVSGTLREYSTTRARGAS